MTSKELDINLKEGIKNWKKANCEECFSTLSSNSLIWKDVYYKLDEDLRDNYLFIAEEGFDIKYNIRDINSFVVSDKKELIKKYKERCNNGFGIDSDTIIKDIDTYLESNSEQEFYAELITFCKEWIEVDKEYRADL